MAQLSVLQAQGMYAGITSVGASVSCKTSNRHPFYRLVHKTESYPKASVFIIAETEVGRSDGDCARLDPSCSQLANNAPVFRHILYS